MPKKTKKKNYISATRCRRSLLFQHQRFKLSGWKDGGIRMPFFTHLVSNINKNTKKTKPLPQN